LNIIYHNDALSQLKLLESESIDLIITSPPYYSLRNYGVEGQIGLEKTPHEYISNLLEIFRECKRVLKKTGSCWVNISDSYNKYKSLIGIPERFVIAMTDDGGWVRRNTIIWHKPNCLPSSVKDRFTIDFEYFYFFVKSKTYYSETQYEPHKLESIIRAKKGFKTSNTKYLEKLTSVGNLRNGSNPLCEQGRIKRTVWTIPEQYYFETQYEQYSDFTLPQINKQYKGQALKDYKKHMAQNPSDTKRSIIKSLDVNRGRIKRTVWKINTIPFPGAHFATFPEKLLETPIKACCPPENGTILDPFMGSGTTALVAKKLGRNYIGIEINSEYIKIANNRIASII
jgi:DNA modification methylase